MTHGTVLQAENNNGMGTVYLAFELSSKQWRLAFGRGDRKVRQKTIDAGDLTALRREIERAKEKLGLPANARVLSCYEAGRDGFWIHRELIQMGVENIVVDSSSIEVNRRARRAKTDRLDVEKLLVLLVRHGTGEQKVWSVVRVPSVEEEDARRVHRELERLKKEGTAHRSRIRSLLVTHGIRAGKKLTPKTLEALRRPDGTMLPPNLKAELERELARLELVDKQKRGLLKERLEWLHDPKTPMQEKARDLMKLVSIGEEGAWTLVHELWGWRTFKNGREVGAALGLVPMPYQSGDSNREGGISKAGNRRARKLLVQLAWMWLRLQPNSALSRWYEKRFGKGGGRMRRIGIVALARKLGIALWRYVDQGVIPDGAVEKAAA